MTKKEKTKQRKEVEKKIDEKEIKETINENTEEILFNSYFCHYSSRRINVIL